jgi:hypothetical protein
MHRPALAAGIAGFAMCVAVGTSVPQNDAPVTHVGWVRMSTAVDGRTTAVTVGVR